MEIDEEVAEEVAEETAKEVDDKLNVDKEELLKPSPAPSPLQKT